MCSTLGFLLFLTSVSLVIALIIRNSSVAKRYGLIEQVYKVRQEYTKERELEMLRKSLIASPPPY
jgi:hypothetical protein